MIEEQRQAANANPPEAEKVSRAEEETTGTPEPNPLRNGTLPSLSSITDRGSVRGIGRGGSSGSPFGFRR
jgi:hypothetical protein